MLFFIIIMYQLVVFFGRVKEDSADIADSFRTLLAILIISWCVYPIMWVIGSEGLGAVSIDLEVGIITLTDLIAKIGFGLYLLFAVMPSEEESEKAEKTSLV